MASNADAPSTSGIRQIIIGPDDRIMCDSSVVINGELLPLDYVLIKRLCRPNGGNESMGLVLYTSIENFTFSYAYIGFVEKVVQWRLKEHYIGKYVDSLDGVVIAYGPIFTSDTPRIVGTQGCCFAKFRTQFILFQPRIGMILDAAVHVKDSVDSNITLALIHNFVNCRALHVPLDDGTNVHPRVKVGSILSVRVTKINVANGILSILADVVDVREGTDAAYLECPMLMTGGSHTPYAMRNQPPRRLLNELTNLQDVFAPRPISFESLNVTPRAPVAIEEDKKEAAVKREAITERPLLTTLAIPDDDMKPSPHDIMSTPVVPKTGAKAHKLADVFGDDLSVVLSDHSNTSKEAKKKKKKRKRASSTPNAVKEE